MSRSEEEEEEEQKEVEEEEDEDEDEVEDEEEEEEEEMASLPEQGGEPPSLRPGGRGPGVGDGGPRAAHRVQCAPHREGLSE